MPRQTAPMGTFILPTTAPVAPLCCPSHPLRCSYSSLRRKGVIFFFVGREGWNRQQNALSYSPYLLHLPQALCGASLCPLPAPPWGRWQPSTVKGRGSHDGFHRWSVEIAGKDLSPVEQQRDWESEREIWLEKGERERVGEKGDKEKLRERVMRRERRGRRRWCLFKEGGMPKRKKGVLWAK